MFKDIYKGKKVLVTGHTGFKGSWLSEWLLQLGAEVGGYALEPYTEPALFDLLGLEKRISHHRIADIRDYKDVHAAFETFQPEIVFHLAAQPLVRDSYDVPKLTFDTNVGGTVNVLEAIRSTPSVKAAVIVTTDKVYENQESKDGYSEEDRLGGEDPYSASKAAAEIVSQSYIRSFFLKEPVRTFVATARAGNVFGGGDWSKDRIVVDCAKSWFEGKPVVVRNPKAVRPWQHVLDCLSGYLWLGVHLWNKNQDIAGESFNFGPTSDAHRDVLSLVQELQKNWESFSWDISQNKEVMKKETNLLWLKTEKASRLLDWMPTLEFSRSVEMTGLWYQDFKARGRECVLSATQNQIRMYVDVAQTKSIEWAK